MTKTEIINKFKELYEVLDNIQESDTLQEEDPNSTDTAMWYVGEAMGSIDNAIDILEDA